MTTGNGSEGRSWAERCYRVMLLGYPREYRQRHGGELLGTLLEAHPSRRLPSVRESAHLLDAGLLTRLRNRPDTVPAWASGLQLGLLLLVLVRAGTMLGHLTTVQQPQLVVLLPSLLVVVAVLLGRMGSAAVLAAIPAVAATYQALVSSGGHGTDTLGGLFASRTFEASGAVNFWMSPGLTQYWVIAAGSAAIALSRRTRGPLPRRSWGWSAVLLAQLAFTVCNSTLMPSGAPANHQPPALPGSAVGVSVLPLIATVGFLLLALRATVAIGDPRWAVAAGVYLIPVAVTAAALAAARPSAVVTLSDQLPAVLLAVGCAVALRRRGPRRAES